MKKTWFYVILLILITFNSLAQKRMRSEQRDEFLKDMVLSFETEFLWKEKGKEIAKELQLKIERGDYDQIMDAELFAATFTRDLFMLSNDRHLTVKIRSEESEQSIENDNNLSATSFTKEEIEKGIYYLKFNEFPRLNKKSKAEIDLLMSSIHKPKVIIIDLRDNYGGSDQTVNFLTGYFFKERTKLAISYRWGKEAHDIWAEPKKASQFIAESKVLILTSQATFSAAEIFTQRLQLHQKAIVIGEHTNGGAHRTSTYVMSDIFLLDWPYERSEHARNHQDLEGLGIKPDIQAHYNNAKNIAFNYAMNKKVENSIEFKQLTKSSLLNAFFDQLNSNDIEEDFALKYLSPQNDKKVMEILQRFKTVWNQDMNLTISNVHYMEDQNIRIIINTTFGLVFMKLIIKDGKIDNLLYRL